MITQVVVFGYGGVQPGTVQCLMEEVALATMDFAKRGNAVEFTVVSNDALISRMRSVVASKFLKSKADVLVMVDHDLIWEPGDVLGIAQRAHERQAIVGGLYSKRALCSGFASQPEPGIQGLKVGTDTFIPAKYLSAGFTAYPRDAFANVLQLDEVKMCTGADGPFFSFFLPLLKPVAGEGHEYLSEDWAFSERARLARVDQLIWAKPKLLHVGDFPYSAVTA